MNKVILGAFGALVLVAVGMFWWQGRAEVERGAPPPEVDIAAPDDPDALSSADVGDLHGPAPPEASELTREQRRFFRYDRNRDLKITRNEMLSTRTDGFRRLDVDGNNLLTFEEWAVTTADRFDEMDADGNRELTAAEFATSAPKPRSTPSCRC
ncbi:EF-hand domain-containing protein [Aurantiacibacter spongiae]|uniref:EF-hand domain-containing protein n=1 Tax=Aurantiacibacter spongiae TaxID=2488860 RepID=A0A3N5DFB1_9SPHN|nr:EF-hand domain-containing protein [Aurantiacibacter spongiae]RPF70332.1 EF-hand domain-containing protein [Aurantiacibacter spongiae]